MKNKSIVELLQRTTLKKTNKNYQRAVKTRKQRGYQWEDTVVKRFNNTKNWKAFRLGSPSTGLPDVLAVSLSYYSRMCRHRHKKAQCFVRADQSYACYADNVSEILRWCICRCYLIYLNKGNRLSHMREFVKNGSS